MYSVMCPYIILQDELSHNIVVCGVELEVGFLVGGVLLLSVMTPPETCFFC